MNYRIGTRGSKLALVQAALVRDRLAAACPDDTFETVVIATRGDVVTDRPIAALGGNAAFTKEIEAALLDGRIDLAVHSMKDLPASCPDGLTLARAWLREDPRDVLVARNGVASLSDLPVGATVATGSPRRDLLLRRIRPDLKIVGIRGNVDTRLRKLFAPEPDEPRLDAIVLAAAGLRRLGRTDVISACLDAETMIPAPNQGQLAVELRAGDAALKAKVDALGHAESEFAAIAERSFLREIGADCHMPVGALATVGDGNVRLRCVFAWASDAAPAFADVTAETPDAAARLAAREIRRQVAGTVTLVGAGPGDPDLITVKGLKAIEEADVLVYDRLVSEALLDRASPGCERVYVGKRSGHHALPQAEINALLARKATTGARVVRLKGGDPFVFGRGGEEAEYLVSRGIACQVVPGVTSAVAAPASFGIPVTHRGVASGFEVVTAHAKDDEPMDIDFSRLQDPRRTCVFLMGLARIPEIAASLMAAGRPADTPAAVISAATTSCARCVAGTLANVADRVTAARLPSPAVLVVGDVVRVRRRLGWPLSGRRFLVPRIEGGGSRLADRLSNLGADVDALPVGRIAARRGSLSAASLEGVTWLVLTSRNALPAFDDETVSAVRARGIRVAAIGKVTAEAAAARGLAPDFVARQSTGPGLLAEFGPVLRKEDVVLHPTADGCADALEGLSQRCAYSAVGVYANEPLPLPETIDLTVYDAAFFTCRSSVCRVMAVAGGRTACLAIGPTTAGALVEAGVADVVTASEPTVESLVGKALEIFEKGETNE